jgi:two-component system LytT family response regulator
MTVAEIAIVCNFPGVVTFQPLHLCASSIFYLLIGPLLIGSKLSSVIVLIPFVNKVVYDQNLDHLVIKFESAEQLQMIRTVIIEDEIKIAEEFKTMLLKASPDTEVLASCSTVRESVEYFSANKAPDLIFSDVQLSDGLSFDIFNQVSIKSPVVFVTGYDKFILNAFEHNGIDYLLKPVEQKDVYKALARYKTLESHFTQHSFIHLFREKFKTRLLVRRGIENISLPLQDIAIIYTENKLVYVVDREGKKYITDKHLSELEQELDESIFFRVNRQYIINVAFIKSYRSYDKVKLQVDLTMPELHHHIVVSQETAPCFRKWISEL